MKLKYADYERRLIAYLFDLGFSFIVATIILTTIGILVEGFTLSTAIKIIVPVSCFVLFLYLTFCYRVARGVSIGGAFCNVRIISKDTTPLKLKTCIVRAALLSLLLLCIYNVFYMFLLRTQVSFYDEATDTRGVERNPTLDVEDLQ